MPLVVPRTPTPIAQASLPGLIAAAFAAERLPLPGIARMMLAVLAAIETARGRACNNHNIGNISASESYTGAIFRPAWFELDPGALQRGELSPRIVFLHGEMLAGRAPKAFRAYASFDEGALDFARVLVRSFPEVMRAATVPNAENFRAALAVKYSKDYAKRPEETTKSLRQLMKEYGVSEASGTGGLVVLALVLFAAWRFLR